MATIFYDWNKSRQQVSTVQHERVDFHNMIEQCATLTNGAHGKLYNLENLLDYISTNFSINLKATTLRYSVFYQCLTLIKYREKYDCLLCLMNVHSWIFIQINACVLNTFCYSESKSACVSSNNAAKYPYHIKLARQALSETKSSIILMHFRTIKAQ